MRKKSKIADELHELGRLARNPMTPAAIAEIKQTLAGSSSLLVSGAAEIAGDKGLHALIPDMIAAFRRFAEDGARVDKGCRAKTAIVKALSTLEHLGDEVFLAGAAMVQM